MDDKDLVDHKTTKKVVAKSQLPKILLLHGKEIFAAIVIGVIITVISSVILDYIFPEIEQEPNTTYFQPPPQIEVSEPNHRGYFIRAGLANVMSSLMPIKTQIHMYFQMTGEFPKKEEDIDISSFDLEEHKHIKSSFMTEVGGIGVYLPEDFGDKKFLLLQPNTSKNGAFIKWRCSTNVDEKYLGIPKNRMCDFQASM